MRYSVPARRSHPRPVLALALALSLGGCAAGGLVSAWKDPEPLAAPMGNVLVVAMKQDPLRRRVWEDGLASELVKHGVSAAASYGQWRDALPDTQQVIESVRANGYDGVIVTFRTEGRTERREVPGYTTVEPKTRRSPWTGAYYTVYVEVQHPARVEESRVVRHETHVWSTKTPGGRLVWAGTIESVDPTSSEQVNRDIARTVVPELAKLGMIAAKAP